jgi:transcriptional regulator with XRE-family HTH domain
MVTNRLEASAALGAQVRAEAAARGVTIKALAAAIGKDRSQLIRYLDGERDFPVSVVYAVADALDMSVSLLISRGVDRLEERQRSEHHAEGVDPAPRAVGARVELPDRA